MHDCCQVFVREEHNFQVSFRGGEGPQLEGGPLKNRYILQQFHCHWGYADEWGSEHQIDGQCFSGELHLVFLNEKYSSVEQALDDAEGICVIGVFLQASNSECESMRPLIAAIKSSKPGTEQLIEDAIDIPSMIATTERYFTYEGSLTTPPCAECVRWIICAEPLKLSRDQLSAMRSMHSCETCYTSETFRPPLPVGKREIFCSFPQK